MGGIRYEVARNIVNLLKEFEKVFAEQLSAVPCNLAHYKIIPKKGSTTPTRVMLQPERPQSLANEKFLIEKLSLWEKLGIVKKVSAKYWSQVHVVNKEGKSPRLCIDWRALNDQVELFQ